MIFIYYDFYTEFYKNLLEPLILAKNEGRYLLMLHTTQRSLFEAIKFYDWQLAHRK